MSWSSWDGLVVLPREPRALCTEFPADPPPPFFRAPPKGLSLSNIEAGKRVDRSLRFLPSVSSHPSLPAVRLHLVGKPSGRLQNRARGPRTPMQIEDNSRQGSAPA